MNTPAILSFIAEAARWAWNTSLIVALPLLLLLALGRVRAFPARARWLVGAALVLRLLLPAVPELPGMHWMPARHLPMPVIAKAEPAPVVTAVFPRVAGPVSAPKQNDPARTATLRWKWVLPVGWAAGVIAVLGWIGFSNRVIRRRILGTAQVCADERVHRHLLWAAQHLGVKHPPQLLVTPALPTVALCGWWRPRILVPPNLCDRFAAGEVRGIFLHELAHVRRRDVLWTWLALLASALHWFNPLVWLMMRRFRADRELECDRIALAHLNEPQKRHFGEALIKTLEAHQWPALAAVVPFSHRQPEILTRILMITRPLTSRWTRITAFIAAPCLVLLALANAGADGEKEPTRAKDGEVPKEAGPRDGEGGAKAGARDGEGANKAGPRDGEGGAKVGARDGEGAKKTGPRDGEGSGKAGARDGEGGRKTGPRDGEGAKKTGPRDGEGGGKSGARDGEGVKKRNRDGESGGEETAEKTSGRHPVVLRVVEKGESVSVDGEVMPLNRLRGYLSEYLPAHAGQKVFIEADNDVPYKSVAETVDAARDNGAKSATLRTARR